MTYCKDGRKESLLKLNTASYGSPSLLYGSECGILYNERKQNKKRNNFLTAVAGN
jgi:hypothetical protein